MLFAIPGGAPSRPANTATGVRVLMAHSAADYDERGTELCVLALVTVIAAPVKLSLDDHGH
jgi:hypothetical protein